MGDTTIPGGLHARLCHAFLDLVSSCFAVVLVMRNIVMSMCVGLSVCLSICMQALSRELHVQTSAIFFLSVAYSRRSILLF